MVFAWSVAFTVCSAHARYRNTDLTWAFRVLPLLYFRYKFRAGFPPTTLR